MGSESTTNRRGFLARAVSAAAAVTLAPHDLAGAQTPPRAPSGHDLWLQEVKGTHRCLFDFPQHKGGAPLLHILNYFNTYQEAYKAAPGTVGAIGTFYSIGTQSSIALGFDDGMWAKYGLGEYLGLKDQSGKAYTRNVFHKPTANDAHLLMQAFQTPNIPELAGAVPAIGIESLQHMGTKFLLCANALGGWCLELQSRGKGKAADLEADLRAHLLPGVTIVPAMVIAIEKAQAAGIRYNRQ
jgi:intracellular sulfur oxidation DsrE/DsrF family protein